MTNDQLFPEAQSIVQNDDSCDTRYTLEGHQNEFCVNSIASKVVNVSY